MPLHHKTGGQSRLKLLKLHFSETTQQNLTVAMLITLANTEKTCNRTPAIQPCPRHVHLDPI